ncbi:MAG: fimbrillin family protein, partial [Bacteroides sp.]
MKRNYQAMGMVAIAMGLWTSCAQTSVIDSAMETKGEIIGFSTYANKTRGVPTSNESFTTNGNAFGVTAFINGTTPEIATPYMGTTTVGAQIKYATTPTAAWNYQTAADARYWPTGTSETLDFYAYAPFTDNERNATPAMSKADGMKFTDYTVPTTSTTTPTTDFAKQKDFMYASALEKTTSSDGVNAGKLTLTFKHALTQILFKAKTNQSNLYVDIQENGIELCNIQSKGTFALTKTAPTTPSWALATPAVHANYTAPTKQVIAGNDNTAVDLIKEQANTPDALMLMPQELTAWTTTPTTAVPLPTTGGNSYLKIMCRIFYSTGPSTTTPVTYENQVYLHGSAGATGATGYAALYVPFSSKAISTSGTEEEAWKMGNKVTYTLIFGGGYNDQGEPILTPITFDTDVTNWNEA